MRRASSPEGLCPSSDPGRAESASCVGTTEPEPPRSPCEADMLGGEQDGGRVCRGSASAPSVTAAKSTPRVPTELPRGESSPHVSARERVLNGGGRGRHTNPAEVVEGKPAWRPATQDGAVGFGKGRPTAPPRTQKLCPTRRRRQRAARGVMPCHPDANRAEPGPPAPRGGRGVHSPSA